MAEEALLEG